MYFMKFILYQCSTSLIGLFGTVLMLVHTYTTQQVAARPRRNPKDDKNPWRCHTCTTGRNCGTQHWLSWQLFTCERSDIYSKKNSKIKPIKTQLHACEVSSDLSYKK